MCWLILTGCATTQPRPEWVYSPPPPATPHAVHLKSFNSLGEIVPPRVTFVDLIRGGPVRPFAEKPAGVDYEDGHLYICDTGLNVVHDWNLATGEARRIGDAGEVILQKPVDVASSSSGTVFVADSERGEVVAFAPDGRTAERFRPPERDDYRPVALAIDSTNPVLAVADVAAHDVDLFPLTDDWYFKRGEHTGNVREIGDAEHRPHYPAGVALRARASTGRTEGSILVSDMFNARIMAFDPGNESVRSIGQPGDRYGDLGQPKHLDVGPDGVIFVADAAFRCVHLFDQEGRVLMLLGGPEDRPGGTPMPLGVAVAESLPDSMTPLVPADFDAHYFVFVTNTIGEKRISLYAIGLPRE